MNIDDLKFTEADCYDYTPYGFEHRERIKCIQFETANNILSERLFWQGITKQIIVKKERGAACSGFYAPPMTKKDLKKQIQELNIENKCLRQTIDQLLEKIQKHSCDY